MFLGPLFLILFIIGIIFVFMSPNLNNRSSNSHPISYMNSNKPLDILKERYAKGEINEEEYIRAKRNLE